MNFKRLLITTILAASQVAMVLPASAEESGQGNQPEVHMTDQGTESGASNQEGPKQEITGETQAGESANDPDADVNGEHEGEGVTEETQQGTEENGEVVLPPEVPTNIDENSTSNSGQLVLMVNSNKMYQNGKEYLAGHPMEVKDGVSYISIRAIVERAGFHLSFDNTTKETIITRGTDELRFQLDTTSYKVNGVVQTMRGKSYSANDNFMVPLTAITKALNITYSYDAVGKKVIVDVSTLPEASFTIGNKEIIAGETQVQYLTNATSPIGLAIVNEEWTGRQEMFETPGDYTVSYRVQDSSGQWSKPFTLTIRVNKPHTPPVANFTTDKDTYKMGELITYADLSTDEVSITERRWENKQWAYFTPGPVTIRLRVVNPFGLESTVEKTITITDETLYTQDDFNKLFIPIGEKYSFDGSQVPSLESIKYSHTSEPVTLIRSNSPENVYQEGIVYREKAAGNTRFMIHHINATGSPMKMYVIATNNNEASARLVQSNLGFAGPSQFATAAGKMSVQRYFESMQTRSKYKETLFAPGESKIIFDELSERPLKPSEVISLFADVSSDQTLDYTVIIINQDKDPFAALPYLSVLAPDIHNRGTYMEANRNIEYTDLIGDKTSRFLLGDNVSDPFLLGYDGPTGEYRMNAGNFGVLYKIKLQRVAPNTLITFNPRGGIYSGVIMVNGSIVNVPDGAPLNAPSETAVLFRVGQQEQSVELVFTAAPGSFLSVNLLFEQMPEKKN
ncbi:copper amine oxidase N-terminal domain-containing protein [Paenibacillus sanguinis]|uniref:copper amine oxidase N-terminal domain-containing protein n=1 Tax=Paenibacillus sanguinis TaxID=225906 RepID=UPI00036359D1|nr:copper amine oxidase N-terminal domain-containing protein [Paenibacillus sanguinis]